MDNSVYSFIILAEMCMSVCMEWGVEDLRRRCALVLLKANECNQQLGDRSLEVFPYLVSIAHRLKVNLPQKS